MVPSSSGLGHLVLIQKIAGSTPAGITLCEFSPAFGYIARAPALARSDAKGFFISHVSCLSFKMKFEPMLLAKIRRSSLGVSGRATGIPRRQAGLANREAILPSGEPITRSFVGNRSELRYNTSLRSVCSEATFTGRFVVLMYPTKIFLFYSKFAFESHKGDYWLSTIFEELYAVISLSDVI